jgi:hypothetical protein
MPTAKPTFETQLLPAAAAASTAYAGKQATHREYNAAIRMAELKPFYETIWAAVKVGDVVLLPWPNGRGLGVVKAEITSLGKKTEDGRTVILAFHQIGDLRMHREFDAEDVAFIQSRF